MLIRSLTLVMSCLFCPAASADTSAEASDDDASNDDAASQAPLSEEEITVTATRTGISTFDATQTATVISRAEIMASPFERLEDIVRSQAGVYNFRHYGMQTHGIMSPLRMRGAGTNRVLLMVDGVPQNDNFNNSMAWMAWGHVPKDAIQQIEILRGPASALHGSEGMGGVINVVTRSSGAERQTMARGEGGTGGTYGGHGVHSQAIGDLEVLLAGGYETTDGFYMVEEPESYETLRYREAGKVLGKVTYNLSPSSHLSLAGLRYGHETGKGREFFYDDLTLDQYWLEYRDRGDIMDIKGLAYLNRADKYTYQDSASDDYASLLRTEHMPATVFGSDLQTLLSLPWSTLTMGVAYKQASWSFDDVYEDSDREAGARGEQRHVSPFINLESRLAGDRLTVSAGARYDWIQTWSGENWDSEGGAGKPAYQNEYDQEASSSLSPALGVAWHPDGKTTLRASGGHGFRAPSLFELYKVHVRQGGTYYREASPGLAPEELWSMEAGAERHLFDSFWGRITGYRTYASDYIGDRLTGTAQFAEGTKTRYEYVLDNISRVESVGVEGELRWYPVSRLQLSGSYTYNHSKVVEDIENAALEGNRVPLDPLHKAHLGIRYQNPRIMNMSLIGGYHADIFYDNENELGEDGWFTIDMSVSRTFLDRFSLYLNAENLLDQRYVILRSQGRADTIAPGLVVMGGMRMEI